MKNLTKTIILLLMVLSIESKAQIVDFNKPIMEGWQLPKRQPDIQWNNIEERQELRRDRLQLEEKRNQLLRQNNTLQTQQLQPNQRVVKRDAYGNITGYLEIRNGTIIESNALGDIQNYYEPLTRPK